MVSVFYNVFLWLLGVLLLSSCSLTGQRRQDALYINIRSQVTTLDPLYSRNQHLVWLSQQIFQTLFKIDTNGYLQPWYARDYHYDSQQKAVIIQLPRQVSLPPNPYQEKLTIKDVVFSLVRLADPKWASPGSWVLLQYVVGADSFYMGKCDSIRGIKVVNDTLLHIYLKKPFPHFPYLLTLPYTAIVPKEAVRLLGKEFGEHPIGSGPFQVRKWVVNQRLILEKNPYYKPTFALNWIYVDFIQDAFSEVIAFLQGGYDLLFSIEPEYLPLLRREERKRGFHLMSLPELGVEYVAVHNEKIPLQVRKALSQAINREALCQYVREGKDIPAVKGFIPEALIPDSVELKLLSYNPEEALKWIQRSGFSYCTLYCSPNRQFLASYLQGAWKRIGVDVRIEVLESQTLRLKGQRGELSLWLASWLADYPHAENFWMLFLSENIPPEGPNITRFQNRYFDSLYFRYLESGGRKVYSQMDSIWKAELPAIPLYYYRQWIGVNKRVRKFPRIVHTLVLPLHRVELRESYEEI